MSPKHRQVSGLQDASVLARSVPGLNRFDLNPVRCLGDQLSDNERPDGHKQKGSHATRASSGQQPVGARSVPPVPTDSIVTVLRWKCLTLGPLFSDEIVTLLCPFPISPSLTAVPLPRSETMSVAWGFHGKS